MPAKALLTEPATVLAVWYQAKAEATDFSPPCSAIKAFAEGSRNDMDKPCALRIAKSSHGTLAKPNNSGTKRELVPGDMRTPRRVRISVPPSTVWLVVDGTRGASRKYSFIPIHQPCLPAQRSVVVALPRSWPCRCVSTWPVRRCGGYSLKRGSLLLVHAQS